MSSYLDARQASRFLHIDIKSLRALVKSGAIKHRVMSGMFCFTYEQLEEYQNRFKND